jgi:hypothetical protein
MVGRHGWARAPPCSPPTPGVSKVARQRLVPLSGPGPRLASGRGFRRQGERTVKSSAPGGPSFSAELSPSLARLFRVQAKPRPETRRGLIGSVKPLLARCDE